MSLYNFERLIKKYSVECKLLSFEECKWKAGVYQKGEATTKEISGAVVPITENRIQSSGGSYKQGDCEFITTQPIEITSDTFLEVHDKKYKLESSTEYSDYADFNIYVARRVSSFDRTGESTGNNAN